MYYYTDPHEKNARTIKAQFEEGWRQAVALAASNGSNSVVILVPTLNSFSGGQAASVLGKPAVDSLLKNRVCTIGGVTVYVETKKSKCGSPASVFYAPFVPTRMLDVLHGDSRVTDVVYIPWQTFDEAEFYTKYPKGVHFA